MDRFLGRHLKRIDAKGRVSIPAPFRGVLQRDGFEGVFAVRSLDLAAVDCGGQRLMAEIDQLIGGYAAFSADHQALSIALLGGSDTLTLDAEGRMFVPEWMRQAADLTDEIVFVGQGNRFQIWAPAAFEVFEAEARHRAAALLRSRGAQASLDSSPKGGAA